MVQSYLEFKEERFSRYETGYFVQVQRDRVVGGLLLLSGPI